MTESNSKILVIYVLGGPGVGKGTQCARLVDDFPFAHISVGELLRAEVRLGTSPHHSVISTYMKNSQVVPAAIAVPLLQHAMDAAATDLFLIDGFPRSIEQTEQFERDVCSDAWMLLFDCDPEVMLKRVLNRAKTSGREDDTESVFWTRWEGYHVDTMPVVEYFRAKKRVIVVDCAGPLDEGYEHVKKVVQECVDRHLAASDGLVKSEGGI